MCKKLPWSLPMLLIFVLFQGNLIMAQEMRTKSNIKLINSREQIKKAIEYNDDEKYDKADRLYSEIPKSDSLYSWALYERALTCYTSNKLDSAMAFCEEGLNLRNNKADFYCLLGSIYDDKKMPQKGIEIFKEGLKQFPYNQMMHYNLAVVYIRIDSLNLAEKELLISAKLNPLHFGTHYYLGRVNETKGRIVEAMLCYNMAILLKPSRTDAVAQLEKFLNGESDIVSQVAKYPRTELEQIPEFERLEEIITSKIALSPKYKTKAKINDIIVKQGQILFDKLTYNPNIDNLYMNYYVPFFINIRDNKYYEPYFYTLFSAYDNEKIQSWLKKKKKKQGKFIDSSRDRILESRKVGLVNLKFAKDTLFYVFDDKGFLNSFGHYSNSDQKTKIGKWTWIHHNGGLESKASYINGKEEGLTVSYNDEGIIEGEVLMKDGTYSGEYKLYHENGILKMNGMALNGKLEGYFTKYYPSGQREECGTINNNKMNGADSGFYLNGQVKYFTNYKNGEINGPFVKYYANGVVSEKANYNEGKANGDYQSFYPDGTIYRSGSYEKGKSVGKWKEFFPNGVLQSEYTLNGKSENIGTQRDYFADGKLEEERVYDGGKSTKTLYAHNGKKYYKSISDDGKIESWEAYDVNGKIIDKAETSAKTLTYKLYNQQGVMETEGQIIKGKLEGKWKFYGSCGQKSEIRFLKNDEIEGNDSLFYDNGVLKMVKPYKKSSLDGYYEEYYTNGSLYKEGWYVDENRQGMWKEYNIDGSISAINYYANDDVEGWQDYFFPNGKLKEQNLIEFGYLTTKILYDTLGKPYCKTTIENGNGPYELKSINGNVKELSSNLIGGSYQGDVKRYYSNGAMRMASNYINDRINGKNQYFDEDGNMTKTIDYINGNMWGDYVTYEDGVKNYEAKNLNNNTFGTVRWFFPNGKTECEYNYLNDQLDGKGTYFAPDGQIMFVVNFENDDPVSYTYKDKSGNFVKPIAIGKDTTHVVAYYKNGIKSADFYYYNGIKNGKCELYYPNGKIYDKYFRLGKDKHGMSYQYYQNGNPRSEDNYYYGQLNGDSKAYYENGTLKSVVPYYYDMKHGVAKYYDAKGNLAKTRVFFYGVLISETKI